MSKMLILYCSYHHGNTEKLVKQVCSKIHEVTYISLLNNDDLPNLVDYEYIGLASGVYMAKPHEQLMKFITQNKQILRNKKIITILTSGSNQGSYGNFFNSFLNQQGLQVTTSFQCRGWDSYGLWKYIGGIGKNHPDSKDVDKLMTVLSL